MTDLNEDKIEIEKIQEIRMALKIKTEDKKMNIEIKEIDLQIIIKSMIIVRRWHIRTLNKPIEHYLMINPKSLNFIILKKKNQN